MSFNRKAQEESVERAGVPQTETIRLFGRITDFENQPLPGAWVCLRNEKFEDLYEGQTDEHGCYELHVQPGLYYTLFACKDYKVNYLEYWAWNLPLFADYELNARTDGLEVYSLSAFPVKRMTRQLMLYFRPMSLKRALAWEQETSLGSQDPSSIIDVGPKLDMADIEVYANGVGCTVHEVNRVVEYGGAGNRIYAYLIHVSLPDSVDLYTYNRIDVELLDRETLERGEGTLFWKEERTVVGI
ncbi:hypothetical protein B9G55_06445 [Saccharibacillus sp. O16]|nr:hypothetical protein B9G55_06445 [Saccharibacillus sp. O16]